VTVFVAEESGRRRSSLDVPMGLFTVAGVILLLPGLLGADHWAMELAVHWQLWVAGSMFVPLLWFGLRGRRLPLLAATLSVAWGFSVAWPYWGAAAVGPAQPGERGARELVVVTVNLLRDLGDHEVALRWALDQDPDVIAIQEVMPGSEEKIRRLLAPRLPHQVFEPRRGSFGMGVASRWPLRDVEKIRVEGASPVQFAATVSVDGDDLRLFCVHVAPPFNGRFARSQRSSLDALASHVKRAGSPVVMAGDFNLTPWCATFGSFVSRTGLADPRLGRGVLPTWAPYWCPLPLLPIDHVLLSPEWRVEELRTGPAFGSDHRPLLVRLRR